MAIKKKAVAVAVSAAKTNNKVESVSTPEVEAKEITGVWDSTPEETSSSNGKEKVLFMGKERILHWEPKPDDPSMDVGWVKVCYQEAYRGPCTLSDVLALKKKYPEAKGFLVEDNVSFNRHNVCVYRKAVLRTRKHVEE